MGRLLTLVAMRNLFQSSLLATLLVFLNSTLLRSTGYPEITHTQSINSLSRPSQLWWCSKSCRSRWWMYTCHNGNRSVHLAVAYTEGAQFRWMTLHQLTMCTSVCHFSFCHNAQHLALNCGGWRWVVWGHLTMYSCVGSSDNV